MSIINKGILNSKTAFLRQVGNDWPTAQVVSTAEIIEAPINLYFTNARAVSAITIGTIPGSISITGNLSANGLIIRGINVSDAVLAGNVVAGTSTSNVILADSITANTWNGLYTANVIETAGNLYFTNTRVVSALIAGDFVTIEANGRISANVGTVTVQAAVQVNNLDNLTTANLAEGTNLYFTNTRARAVYTAGKGINIDTQGVIKNTGRTALYNTDINGTGGGNVLSTMSTILTLPTIPATDRFLLRSLLVTNLSDSTSYVSGNILYATGNTAVFANQIHIATGGLVEFIKNGQLFQPGDKINLQGFNSASAATANILNAMYTYETFDNDATYIGVGQTLATSNTNITIYNSLNGYSIVESIILVNVSASTPRIKLYWADANGTPKVYLAYNTPIPTNSSASVRPAHLSLSKPLC